jgi:signal transduction histidine kinase
MYCRNRHICDHSFVPGPAERELLRLGRRYAVVSRAAVVLGCGALGLFLVSGTRLVAAAVCLSVLIAWSAVFTRRMLRAGEIGEDRRWLAGDLAVVSGVLLSQHWTIPTTGVADGTGWMMALASMTVVTYQWHTRPVTGGIAALVLVAAYVVGIETSIGGDGPVWPMPAVWVLVEALLSRGLFVMIRQGGRRADGYLVARERVHAAAAIGRARRADEREYLAALHDTAAATLLMVGLGTVSGRPAWLAEQARRDLEVLGPDARTAPAEPLVDLGAWLAETTSGGAVTVRHAPLRTVLLPPVAAAAIRDSVREALTNVARHAAVSEASLSLRQEGRRLIVEVRDGGRGFDPARVPLHRRGISESIAERMRRAGGSAAVTSEPGGGTVVHLEWSDA